MNAPGVRSVRWLTRDVVEVDELGLLRIYDLSWLSLSYIK